MYEQIEIWKVEVAKFFFKCTEIAAVASVYARRVRNCSGNPTIGDIQVATWTLEQSCTGGQASSNKEE